MVKQNGNILSKTEYAGTEGAVGEPTNVQKYTYMKTGWNDLLHTYNNRIVTHDDLGNPLRYRDNLRFTWVGRLMATAKTSATATSSYSYAQSGLRLKKEYQDGTEVVTHTYDYDGTLLVREKYGDTTLWFMYDESGSPIGFIKQDGTTRTPYYYVKNAQGDVLAITNGGAGTILCKYQYDSWGKLLAVKDSYGNDISSDKNNIANINPIRYRGYYYDNETGLYYLQSRYYDPVMGRFVNSDSVMGMNDTLQSYNLFSYCGNNPISRYDTGGNFWKECIRYISHRCNDFAVAIGIDTAAIGAFFLMMKKDDNGIYSASYWCWQMLGGYNDFYDYVFDVFTSCKSAKLDFTYNGTDYIFWAWKGDYINLGAGAEMGFYFGGEPLWLVNAIRPMPMYFFLQYKGEYIISHGATTWWVTGFNPAYLNVKAEDLTVMFGVRFNNRGMFEAFYKRWQTDPRFQFYPYDGNGRFHFTF